MISPTDYQGRYEELKRIIRAEWNPAERIAALALMVQAWEGDSVDRLGKWTQVGNGGATDVAEIAGISRSTANNIINKFVGVGIVSREVSKTPVNRFGEEIPARKMNPDNGDRWQNISTIAVLAKLPDVLPALAETAYTAKQRTKATIITTIIYVPLYARLRPYSCQAAPL